MKLHNSTFGTRWQLSKWPNMKIFKIQDGGRLPYWRSFLVITQQPIAVFQWNVVCGSSFSTDFRQWDGYRRFTERISCFPNTFRASAWSAANSSYREWEYCCRCSWETWWNERSTRGYIYSMKIIGSPFRRSTYQCRSTRTECSYIRTAVIWSHWLRTSLRRLPTRFSR